VRFYTFSCVIIFLFEELVYRYHILEYTTIFIISKTIGRNEYWMHSVFTGYLFCHNLFPMIQFLIICFVNCKILAIELHLTHIDDMVSPLNYQVNLRPFFFIVTP